MAFSAAAEAPNQRCAANFFKASLCLVLVFAFGFVIYNTLLNQ